MSLIDRRSLCSFACGFILYAFASISIPNPANAAVVITDDPSTLIYLEKPTGDFDEPSLGGFEYLISSRTNQFRANDQYLIVGEEPDDQTALVADLGTVGDLSGAAFDFSIQHNLIGGRNFRFSLINRDTGEISELCWGDNCPPGATSTPILNGQTPINNYNGLQIQVRAQEVLGSSATVENLFLSGLDITSGSDPLFDGSVTPSTLGTLPFDFGRAIKWIIGDSLDLVVTEWVLTGTVTLVRPDAATSDLSNVRLAVDFVNDTRLPTLSVPASVLEITNESTRGFVGTGDDRMIIGFVAEGSGTQQFILFGLGPTLEASGISGALPDPKITLVNNVTGATISSNDDWQDHPSADRTAQVLSQWGVTLEDLDAAMVIDLAAGSYTLTVEGVGGTTGTALGGVEKTPVPN